MVYVIAVSLLLGVALGMVISDSIHRAARLPAASRRGIDRARRDGRLIVPPPIGWRDSWAADSADRLNEPERKP